MKEFGKKRVYFDQAATSFPKPPAVIRAVEKALTVYGGNPGHGGHEMAMAAADQVFLARERTGRFFGAEPERVIFTPSCTAALNTAVKGIMRGGGHLLLSNYDHNASLRPAAALVRMGKCRASLFKVYEEDPERTLTEFRAALRSDTHAVVCTHASNVTGFVLPVREICAVCREKGILFILDAAQTAGVLPVGTDMADILCVPGHKGLLGPAGTGIMILGKRVSPSAVPPLLEGGTGIRSLEAGMPEESPERFEAGTLNLPGIMGLSAGIGEVEKRRLAEIYRKELRMARLFYDGAREIPGIRLVSRRPEAGKSVATVSFTLTGQDSARVSERLSEEGFMLRGGFHCAGAIHAALGTEKSGTVRFSCGAEAEEREVLRFLEILQKIARDS